MAARAMWKAVIRIGDEAVPIKLYSALQDRDVHFRLLHRKDLAPVKQAMVNPDSDEVVPFESVRRGVFTGEGDLVMFDKEELESLEPEASRDIEVMHFLPPSLIDHRWYKRPYYLGPDGSDGKYAALIQALAESKREGLARWTMRKKSYIGTLRLHQGYPILIALRHAEEVVAIEKIETPKGAELDKREIDMAQQLITMLAAEFEPEQYHDEFRNQVISLIQTKASGGRVTSIKARRKARSEDLSKALEASLQQANKDRKRA